MMNKTSNKYLPVVASLGLLLLAILFALVSPNKSSTGITGNAINDIPLSCNIASTLLINDPLGDASRGAPSYVDIKSLKMNQIGQYVQFIWEGNGSLYNNDNQYYFIFLDTDFNKNTGQNWGGKIGAEIKIIIDRNSRTIVYFDSLGNVLSQIGNIPVIFYGNKFYISIEKNKIFYGNFSLYFESSGEGSYKDEGSLINTSIQSSLDDSNLIVKSESQILNSPPLINISQKNATIQINTYIVKDNSQTLIPSENIVYLLTHQETDPRIGNLSLIISIASNGAAKYLKEGYVLVNALYQSCDAISNQPTIIATGDIYGNISSDNVLAVFPKDYAPYNNGNTFGYMFSTYSSSIKMLNIAYNLASQLYGGYTPFDKNKQIFSMEISTDPLNPFYCYNGNPLSSSPTCYINSDGSPEYNAPIHEMGHNFGASDFGSRGMRQLLYQNPKINGAGFGECVASLPVIYTATEFYNNPEKYGFNRTSYEWNYYKNFLQGDIPGSNNTLSNFENSLRARRLTSIFNYTGTSDGIPVFCSLFQQYSYNFTNDSNPYKNEVIKRFLTLFGDNELQNFRPAEVETYFSAAYSVAVGRDMRTKLRFWGFTINDSYFNELYPQLNFSMDHKTEIGDYSGFYNFPNTFFDNSSLTSKEVLKVTDAIYLALKDMHNGIKPYDFCTINYSEEVYGSTQANGLILGKSASPSFNNGHHSWDVMAHEQGHNFFGGTSSFYYQLSVPYPFLQESLAVLSASYTENFISKNNASGRISSAALNDISYVFQDEDNYQESRYNEYISSGKKFNISDVLTSQALDWKMIQYGKQYGWENYKKFSKAFETENSNKFTFEDDGASAEEQSTYIIAVLSASFNRDFRQEFRDLNFSINETLYSQIYPIIQSAITNQSEYFDGNSTSLTGANLANITNLTLEKSAYGKIEFLGAVNLSKYGYGLLQTLINNVNISAKKISISTNNLTELKNISAKLTFRNIDFTRPKIKHEGLDCPSSVCYSISYDSTNKILIVNVTGFSEFEVVEGYQTPGGGNGGGNGGGGGSGGNCTPDWICQWSSCINGMKTYNCTDVNTCNTQQGRPQTQTTACTIGNITPPQTETIPLPNEGGKISRFPSRLLLIIILLGVLTIAIILILVLILRRIVRIKQEKQEIIQKAKAFVLGARARGYNNEQIKDMFRQKNWTEEDIIKLFI